MTAWSTIVVEKLVPVMVMSVPPRIEPEVGLMAVTVEEVWNEMAVVSSKP